MEAMPVGNVRPQVADLERPRCPSYEQLKFMLVKHLQPRATNESGEAAHEVRAVQ